MVVLKSARTGSTWLARELHNHARCVERFIAPTHGADLRLKGDDAGFSLAQLDVASRCLEGGACRGVA